MRRISLIFMLLNLIILINGCWDIREINELGLVTAVGIDKAEGQNKYSITVQIANPSNENASEGNNAAKKTVWIGTAEGNHYLMQQEILSIFPQEGLCGHTTM